jgi:hypothetical protein
MPRGIRQSEWLVIRRCLAIICRVQRGPASWQELVQAVLDREQSDAYGQTGRKNLHKRLENDLERIRERLMIDVSFDRRSGGYVIRDIWQPLFDLPDEDLATIAWLEQTFDYDSPQHDQVHALLGRLRFYLGLRRQRAIEKHRTALAVDLHRRDEDEIDPEVWGRLSRALASRRRIAFSYRSPRHADGAPRRHVVDPDRRFFDPGRGHYYLRGWCRTIDGPDGRRRHGDYIRYRLGRITDLEVLPHKLTPELPPARRYEVVYELKPEVARQGISRPRDIEVDAVEPQADGSAIVRGSTTDLFWAIQALMHYRYNCRVLGGPEFLATMRRTVQKMAEVYGVVG